MVALHNILLLIAFYFALLVIVSLNGRKIERPEEKKTYLLLWIGGSIVAFSSNILLEKLGLMTHLPLLNNAIHTGLWIGAGFPYMWFATRGKPVWVTFIVFLTTSLIIKYVELHLFGIWDGDGFLGLGHGAFTYIFGWSAVDGLLPFVMTIALKLIGKFVPGLALN